MTAPSIHPEMYHCMIDGQTMLLDLRRNRYLQLQGAASTIFQNVAHGRLTDLEDCRHIRRLIDQGIVIETDNSDQKSTLTQFRPVETSVLDMLTSESDIWKTIRALSVRWSTAKEFARRPLYEMIHQIRVRKITNANLKEHLIDSRLIKILNCFNQTQKFISKQDKCLIWSCAMINYLYSYKYFPDLVIGVKTAPFAAHAWVQQGSTVLTGDIDEVLPYTPILVV